MRRLEKLLKLPCKKHTHQSTRLEKSASFLVCSPPAEVSATARHQVLRKVKKQANASTKASQQSH